MGRSPEGCRFLYNLPQSVLSGPTAKSSFQKFVETLKCISPMHFNVNIFRNNPYKIRLYGHSILCLSREGRRRSTFNLLETNWKNMNKICRICLEEGVLSSIFTKSYNISLCDMLEYCCNAKINKNDGLPEQICGNCIYKLGVAYSFKQTYESSNIRLRQYLGLEPPIKTSDAAIMTDPVPVVTHTIIRKCKCQIGSKKSSNNYKRKAESEKQKRGPKPKPKQVHQCYQCDKEFRCQAQLEMHVRTHTGDRPFGCMYCSRSFTQKHNLTIHLRVHTGEKPFQCEICSKRFSAQGNLQTHLKIHTGQRDHNCALCHKSFITSSELTRHMCKHRGVKDHKCDICGHAFVQSRDLKLHKLKKHQIEDKSKADKKEIIDIIGIDVGKDKDKEKPDIEKKIAWNPEKQPFKPFEVQTPEASYPARHSKESIDITQGLTEEKGTKHMFNLYGRENQSCSVCGEQFEFLTALAQHYMLRHKGYEPTHTTDYILPD